MNTYIVVHTSKLSLFIFYTIDIIISALSVTMRMRNKFRLKILRKSKKAADEKIRYVYNNLF